MEPQTRFDLEEALRAWQADCASRPGISYDNARELESDLRERVADFLKQGLNEREAFSQAVRQVGSPGELAREFARENPLAVWRERLFWMVAAGFGVSVWGLLTNGTIVWFVNTFYALLPLVGPAWFSLAGSLPLLAMALLLATGKLENLPVSTRCFGRRHLALGGGCLLAAGLLLRLFGPAPLISHVSLLVKVVSISLWPLLLLFLGISLFRPAHAATSTPLASGPLRLPRTVWRERVFWMAVGALAAGIWQTASWVGMQALFYTGDMNRPFLVKTSVFVGTYLLMLLGPLIVLGILLRHRMRVGKDVTAGKLVGSRAMFVFIPVAVCAWAALHLWSQHSWRPAGVDISWSAIVANYFTTFRWLWPAGVAWLILWLAPGREIQTGGSVAPALD